MSGYNKKQPKVEIVRKERLSDGFIKLDKITANILTAKNQRLIITREVHDHGDSVTILPIDKKRKKVILISQWRLPVWINNYKQRLWEAPAGLLEQNELPENCAARETLEETGYEINNIRLICQTFSSPGLITERKHIFLADYSPRSKKHSTLGLEHEGEDIELKEISFEELFVMLDKSEIHDAATIIAAYALKEELRQS